MNILIKNVIVNFQDFPEFTDEELDKIASHFVYQRVRRKKVVLDLDEPSDNVYYVISGCLRLYCMSPEQKEYTLLFGPKDYWLADFQGFLNQETTNMMVDSIIDTEYLTLSYESREALFKEFPKVEQYFRILLEKNAAFMQKKQILDKKHDARERYEDFCELYPSILGRAKDKHVASYIGVTPEFFSKMINSKQM